MEVLYRVKFERFNTVFYKEHTNIPPSNPKSFLDDESVLVMNATEKHPLFTHKSSSTSEEDFEKNYGNPMCSVSVSRVTVVVEKNEDKVSAKLFLYEKNRSAGKVYFTKSSKMFFVTYKFSTNDVYNGQVINSFKKRKFVKWVRRNYFLSKPFKHFSVVLQNCISTYKDMNIDCNSVTIMGDVIKNFESQIPNFENNFPYDLDENLYKHYLKVRGIKYPDNFTVYHTSFFPLPNKRILKKAKNKLVDAFMISNQICGDKVRKILHVVDFINVNFFKQVTEFFGEKYIKNQDDNFIKNLFQFKSGYNIPAIDGISKKERDNSFMVFKEVLENRQNLGYSFIDHINMYNQIKKFESIKWKSTNIEEFNKEHLDWTEKYTNYTKGKYTRFYDEKFLSKLREPLLENYFPVPLTNSEEYVEESFRQSNCVKTYVDKCASFCISLRKDSPDGNDRATIEYIMNKKSDGVISFSRLQSLGRFNSKLNESWNNVLSVLDVKMDYLSRTTNFSTPKVKVEVYNTEFESDSEFSDYGLQWTSPFLKTITPNYLMNNFEHLF